MQQERYFWLIRHGKTLDGSPDHERELSPRGHKDAKLLQACFSSHSHSAQWVWSSDAKRALQTATYVQSAFSNPNGQAVDLIVQPQLYLAGPEAILNCLQITPENINVCALVAHNPGLTQCTNLFAQTTITNNLPTFGVALFSFTGEWPDLTFGNTTLINTYTPKTLRNPPPTGTLT